ncbi:outer membrane beta-barrel protein [Pedobacter frigoris]|uniref:outer membrane beta-barrel protein n=1 Tax=Pedobacter frigoris TaxID=2571272 RepID=UPI00293108BC|nr:outer membrane beta-barrel protein [Pedobacter frigoris]
MKKITLSLFFLLLSCVVFAQKNGVITGSLVDSTNHKVTLNYATVSVFKAGDTVLITYKLSDDKGVFVINGLQTGIKYKLVINAWQYHILRKEVMLEASSPKIDLGQLILSEKANNLQEIVIKAERPPIIVRKDTIEFNAESFKTLPSAVVEDLLKKLPGVSLDDDGNIKVNGKSVSKILVDGKEFFGGDQQIATKNLPANIIDKVQVMDDQEAKRANPDLVAADVPQVINLKLKRAIKQGMFGKLYGGGGSAELFETGGILNVFRDTSQVSVLGYGNNVNKPGFSMADIQRIGGFARGGSSSMMISSSGGFSLDNISFGGLGSGVQTSAGAGANFNTVTKKGIKINAKYFYGQTSDLITRETNEDQKLGQGSLITRNSSKQENKNYIHTISGRIDFKIDSLTSLFITPSVSLGTSRGDGLDLKNSYRGSDTKINDAENNSISDGSNTDYSVSATLNRSFKKRGRSFNSNLNINKKDNGNDNFNTSVVNFYDDGTSRNIDQLRGNEVRNFGMSLSANYSEPISKELSLSFVARSNYLDNENALATFYKNPLNQSFDIAVPSLSETVRQSGIKNNLASSLRWRITKDLDINPGMVFNTISLRNRFIKYENFNQNYAFFAPQLSVRYKILSMQYTPSFSEPNVNSIQPVANNTDPLFIQEGNTSLQPEKSHSVYLSMFKYDLKQSMNYNFSINGSLRDNSTVMSRKVSAEGVQTSRPVNVNGIWSFSMFGNLSKDYKNEKTQINVGLGFSTGYRKSLVIVNDIKSNTYNFSFTPRANIRFNLNDKFEFSQRYSITSNKSMYDDPFYTDLRTISQTSSSELVVRFPKGVVWESNYNIQFNNQKVAGFNNRLQMWNAGVYFLFLKNDRLQLKFSVNDILNSNVGRTVYISENSIRDMQTNNLGRYGLMTLTYNIQNFGGKVGGKERFFGF